LYLVPACLGSSALTALVRGDFKKILKYNEDEEEEKASGKSSTSNGTSSKEAKFIQTQLKKGQ